MPSSTVAPIDQVGQQKKCAHHDANTDEDHDFKLTLLSA
jgi:hypothetical protein